MSKFVNKVKISEKEFWEAVDVADWKHCYNKRKGYKTVQKNLAKKYKDKSKAWFDKLHSMVRDKEDSLYDLYPKEGLIPSKTPGDDSWWDIRSTIVGFGKESYEKALKDQSYIVDIINKDKWSENFGYGVCKETIEDKD